MEFKTELEKYVAIIEKELKKQERSKEVPEGTWNEAMEYSLMAGGKRLRPVLILATYQLFKENISVCFPFATAMEMIHNFSLIHDDLPGIDNDDFRHGKPTNHKKYNEATAILAGDGLLNRAYEILIQDVSEEKDNILKQRKIECLLELSHSIDRMIAGEYVDTEYEGKHISEEFLEYMHTNKTGALLKVSVRIGARLAFASEEQMEKLTLYAEKIGLAFQIKDDILSETGNEKTLGKPVGNDRQKGKCTYVTKYGIQKAQEMLDTLIKDSIEIIDTFGEKGIFLKQLSKYIEDREK